MLFARKGSANGLLARRIRRTRREKKDLRRSAELVFVGLPEFGGRGEGGRLLRPWRKQRCLHTNHDADRNRLDFGKLDFCGKWDFVPGIMVDYKRNGLRTLRWPKELNVANDAEDF